MPVVIDTVIAELRAQMHVVDFELAVAKEFTRLVETVVSERISAALLWFRLLRDHFPSNSPELAAALRDPNERKNLKKLMKREAPKRLRTFLRVMLDIPSDEREVALVDPRALGLDPEKFIETFYYDNQSHAFVSYMDPGKAIVRIYYSLDHKLGQGSEGTLHVALLGAALKTSDDESLPLHRRYTPLRDRYGNLIVSKDIMVAKKPIEKKDKRSKVDAKRHQAGSINLRDLTLPHFYTEESKKTLPGLWSLPRFTDFGADKRLYYRYVEGVPLSAVVNERSFDILARLISMKHVAQTLHYMHSMGYIHNDIKPQNVIGANTGIATIIDFGLTEKYLDAHKNLDAKLKDKIVGTPFYMSPEQVTKRPSGSRSIGDIGYVGPIHSLDELAQLRREDPERIVQIEGIEFQRIGRDLNVPKSPFFYDGYLHQNFFCDEKGTAVPITGKSDIFSLGVNILHLTTGKSHVKNAHDVKSILEDLSRYRINLPDFAEHLPPPVHPETVSNCSRSYQEVLGELIEDCLHEHPYRRPPAREVAQRLREAIWLCFNGDRSFFSTFDDECTYLRNRLYRRQSVSA